MKQRSLLGAERTRVTSLEERLEALRTTDWNFKAAKTQEGVHRIHPYPAKFIPQIPRRLIELLHAGDGSAVLDPFCGSGTALVEAQALGYPAIGIDLNPLAALIAKVKTHPPGVSLLPSAARAVARATRTVQKIPPIPRLDHWFESVVQEALAALVGAIAAVVDVRVREALQVALSSIIVRVSNQESDTRYAAIQKPGLCKESVYDAFRRAAEDLERAFAEQYGPRRHGDLRDVQVLARNTLHVRPGEMGPVGMVVTSPPYPNAYEYWLYHKYRMYWLGMDPIAVREQEIGARPHFFKKNPHTAEDFGRQMSTVFALLSKVLVPGGLACFVVGRSIIRGREVDNGALLARAASRHGFRALAEVVRAIPGTRKAFNPVHGTITRETIVVFGR